MRTLAFYFHAMTFFIHSPHTHAHINSFTHALTFHIPRSLALSVSYFLCSFFILLPPSITPVKPLYTSAHILRPSRYNSYRRPKHDSDWCLFFFFCISGIYHSYSATKPKRTLACSREWLIWLKRRRDTMDMTMHK